MIKKYKLFSTPNCIKCKSIKKYLEDVENVESEIIDTSSPEGLDQAKEMGVNSIPTIFFYDENNEKVGEAHDVDEVEEFV